MADPADAATATANDEDVDDLYADLDDQVTAALAAAGESGGSNAKDSDAEADANEAVDLGDGVAGYSSSSEDESEDDLHIVLNEDGCAPPPPSAGRCEEENEEGEARGSLVRGLSVNDGGPRKLGGHHYKGLLDKTTVPITGQGDISHQHAFQKDYYFFLPRNRTVFDINIEAFHQKPWRQHGALAHDYFNFGLDEEGWRKYCFGIKQFTQEGRSLAEKSSGMDQESHHNLESCKSMQKSATYSALEGSNDLAKPKGRAIHVEGGLFERLPSADLWRPRQRDSDVVIQVNMTLSPSNHSSSDDNSAVNDKCMTTERILVNSPVVKCFKDTSLVVDRVVDKGVLSGSSSECTGSKLDIRDSACTRDHSSSHDYSDMLSEESTEDCYFKRANRHSNSKALRSDTKFKDAHVRSVLCRHSSKSDKECRKGDSHGYTPSSSDRYHKTIKSPRTHELDFMSSGVYVSRQNVHCLLKPRHEEQKRKGSPRVRHDRHDVFNKEEKITDSYRRSYAREYEGKISDSTFLSNDCRDAVRNKVYEKRDYSPVERATLRNDVQLFGRNSNHQRSRSWHEFSDDEDVVQNFSSAKGWQQRHDYGYGYKSMLKAEFSDDIDGRVYRESYYQETRRVRQGHSEDDEVLHYNDYRSRERRSPEVRGEYRNRRSAESSYEHSGHPYHLVLSPRANDYPKSSERDWPSPGLTSLNSRSRCTGNERIRHAKMMRYDHDGYNQNNKQYSPSFHVGNIQRSALYTGAGAETGYCFLPVKRKLHADLGSVNHKDLVGLAFPKGRRLTHHQPLISDRKLYAAEVHNSPNEFVREAIVGFGDMRNNKTILNIERRHERVNFQLKDADSIHLNDRKRKIAAKIIVFVVGNPTPLKFLKYKLMCMKSLGLSFNI